MQGYRGYKVIGKTAFASGKKFCYPSNSTINALLSRGVSLIVWQNGDFFAL